MELQTYIDSTSNFVDELKSRGFITKSFGKYNLLLIKYKYDKKINTDSYERYLKGVLIDKNTNRVVFIPPCKSSEYVEENVADCVVEELYDGTMINLFYHQEQWILSTRSDIGLNNKWGNKSFKKMFEECAKLDYDKLNREYTYSFVLQHMENRNVTIFSQNNLILVEVRNKNTLEIIDNSTINNSGFMKVMPLTEENIQQCKDLLKNNDFNSFNWKGLTFKKNDKRMNVVNPMYDYVKQLKVNSNNKLYNFCSLWKDGKLDNYLYFFNEDTDMFKKYKTVFSIFIKELYDNYVQIHIKKEKVLSDSPFQLKPLVYSLHGEYLKTKIKINYNKIEEFVKLLPVEKITFVLKYYL